MTSSNAYNLSSKAGRTRELETGLLNHACKVVSSCRSFLCRMIDLLHAGPSSQTHIRVNAGFCSNLAWGNLFADNWNGISFLPPPSHLPSVEVTTDASGSWGCDAWCGRSWFQLRWDHRSLSLSIAHCTRLCSMGCELERTSSALPR